MLFNKRAFFILLIAVLVLPALVIPSVGAQSDQVTANKAVALRLYQEIFNDHQVEVFNELVTPNIVIHDPIRGEINREQFIESRTAWFAAMPDISLLNITQIGAGDLVANSYFLDGTLTEAMGVQPPLVGKPLCDNFLDMVRFENGKIAEIWWMYHTMEYMQQMGAAPLQGRFAYRGPLGVSLGTTSSTPEEHIALINQEFKAAGDNTPDLIPALYTEDAVIHITGADLDVAGLQAWITGDKAIFPDHHIEVQDIVAEGNLAIVRYNSVDTFINEFNGIAPTGATLVTPCMSLYVFEDGKIKEEWWLVDVYGLMQQLTAPAAQ